MFIKYPCFKEYGINNLWYNYNLFKNGIDKYIIFKVVTMSEGGNILCNLCEIA